MDDIALQYFSPHISYYSLFFPSLPGTVGALCLFHASSDPGKLSRYLLALYSISFEILIKHCIF